MTTQSKRPQPKDQQDIDTPVPTGGSPESAPAPPGSAAIPPEPGGVSPAPSFELSGGELCLDFANTVDSRPTEEPLELLPDFDGLVAWSLQAKVLPSVDAEEILEEAARHPRRGAAVLKQAREVREAIFQIFSATAQGTEPPGGAMALLNRNLPAALGHRRIVREDAGYRWEWEEGDSLGRMLWPILTSTADLLTSQRLSRVRLCSAENCDWLFLDQSKNRSRRWCDMAVCGNRSKVRRFRRAHSGS